MRAPGFCGLTRLLFVDAGGEGTSFLEEVEPGVCLLGTSRVISGNQ